MSDTMPETGMTPLWIRQGSYSCDSRNCMGPILFMMTSSDQLVYEYSHSIKNSSVLIKYFSRHSLIQFRLKIVAKLDTNQTTAPRYLFWIFNLDRLFEGNQPASAWGISLGGVLFSIETNLRAASSNCSIPSRFDHSSRMARSRVSFAASPSKPLECCHWLIVPPTICFCAGFKHFSSLNVLLILQHRFTTLNACSCAPIVLNWSL